MKKIIIYIYPKCSTCRKAINWLNQGGFEFEIIDIVENPPSKDLIKIALKDLDQNKKKIFNTRGKSYRELNLNALNSIPDEELVELLINDGKLIKRPFLILDKSKILLGFNEDEYKLNINN